MFNIKNKMLNSVITSLLSLMIASIAGGIGYLILVGYNQPAINQSIKDRIYILEASTSERISNTNTRIDKVIDNEGGKDSTIIRVLQEMQLEQKKQARSIKLIIENTNELKPFKNFFDCENLN